MSDDLAARLLASFVIVAHCHCGDHQTGTANRLTADGWSRVRETWLCPRHTARAARMAAARTCADDVLARLTPLDTLDAHEGDDHD